MLCQRCRRWVLQAIEYVRNHDSEYRELDTVTLVESDMRCRVFNGCHICNRLFARVQYWGSSTGPLTPLGVQVRYYPHLKAPSCYQLLFLEEMSSGAGVFLAFGIDLSSSQVRRRAYPVSSIAAQSSEASKARPCFVIAKRWLEECVKSHVSCSYQIRNYTPRRLLKISGRPVETICYLVSRHHAPTHAKYCTLSHRWGPQDQQLKLTTHNEANLNGGISTRLLTRMVREAVELAQVLSIQYLWVDSLCIMQDNVADLQEQIQDMGKIYGRAICNIMALAGQPDRLFEPRECAVIDPTQATVSFLARASSKRMVVNLLEDAYWEREVEEGPLLQRGWVLQERFSAQRTLFIGQKELLWECYAGRRCELYPSIAAWPDDLEPHSKHSHMFHGDDILLRAIRFRSQTEALGQNSRLGYEGRREMHYAWRELVTRYSGMRLTFRSDKIAAIRGIAHAFSEVTNDCWVAGNWQGDMQYSLLWYKVYPEPPEAGQFERFPSWSWASRSGKVYFPTPSRWQLIPLSTLVSINSLLNQESGNPSVDRASVTLTAAVVDVVKCPLTATFGILDGSAVWNLQIFLDMAGDCESEIGRVPSGKFWINDGEQPLHSFDTSYEMLDPSFKCIIISVMVLGLPFRHYHYIDVFGLLLRRTEDAESLYRRAALVRMMLQGTASPQPQWLPRALFEPQDLDEQMAISAPPHLLQTVTII